MARSMQLIHLRVDDELYETIGNIANKSGESKAEVVRELVRKGLQKEITEDNSDYLATLIREQMDIVIKPHVERLAAISSKSGHMSATAAFLNVQSLIDLVPAERRKEPKEMYEKARKKAVLYMKTKTDDFNNE